MQEHAASSSRVNETLKINWLTNFMIFASTAFGSEKIYYEGMSTICLMHGISAKLHDQHFKCHISEYKTTGKIMLILLFTLFSDNLKAVHDIQ
jgi:hypothetical protein